MRGQRSLLFRPTQSHHNARLIALAEWGGDSLADRANADVGSSLLYLMRWRGIQSGTSCVHAVITAVEDTHFVIHSPDFDATHYPDEPESLILVGRPESGNRKILKTDPNILAFD